MTVRVITDSAASLPATLALEEQITVVPLHLVIRGRDVVDGSIGIDEVLQVPPADVQTSGASPGDFAAAVDGAGGDGAVVLTIASGMSSTYDAAVLGARNAEARSVVIDTQTAAGAQGLVVLAAARAAASGASLEEVATIARVAVGQVRLVAAVEDLRRLVEGGRVPGIAGWAGRVLGVTPLFEFRGGSVHRLAPAHGRERAVNTLIRRLRADRSRLMHAAVVHANDPDGASDLVERVRKVGDPATLFVGEFSPVMVAHTGPLLGVAWRYEP